MTAITTTRPVRAAAVVPMVRRKKLLHLQALRGLAASLVVLSHCADTLGRYHSFPTRYAARLAISGYFGVATFFIISGFIIYKTSAGSFGQPAAITVFVLKRLIRIFPIYWVATAVFVVLSPHRADYSVSDIIFSSLLIPHALPSADNLHPLIGQGWTLHYELLFYLIFAIGLFLDRRIGTVLIVTTLAVLVAAGDSIMPLSSMTEPFTLAAYWTRPILLLFIVGIGLGILEERLPHSFSVPHPFLVMLALLSIWFIYSLAVPLTASQQIQFPTSLAIWLLCAGLVFASIFGRSAMGLEGVFENLAEHFGDASYSVYLFHTFVISALLRLKLQDASPLLFTITAIVVSNIFGFVLYRCIERPILLGCRGWLRTGA